MANYPYILVSRCISCIVLAFFWKLVEEEEFVGSYTCVAYAAGKQTTAKEEEREKTQASNLFD